MKKIILFITLAVFIIGTASYSAENYLNAVLLEGTGNGTYNIVLRSDAIASVKRSVESSDKISLNIRGLTASDEISTMYKNTSTANGIVVENIGSNTVKVQVEGKNIAKANIIFDSPASAPIVVSDGISKKALGWSIFALAALCFVFAKSRTLKFESNDRIRAAVQKNIRDREVAMYKNYRRELLVKPSIDYKVTNPRMRRAIREADTIRHLQRMSRV